MKETQFFHERNNKLDFIKIKKLLLLKENIKRLETKFENTHSIKNLSKIHKELLKFNSKKKTWLKLEQIIWTGTSPKTIYTWQISIVIDALYHLLPGKLKLKTMRYDYPDSEIFSGKQKSYQALGRYVRNINITCI